MSQQYPTILILDDRSASIQAAEAAVRQLQYDSILLVKHLDECLVLLEAGSGDILLVHDSFGDGQIDVDQIANMITEKYSLPVVFYSSQQIESTLILGSRRKLIGHIEDSEWLKMVLQRIDSERSSVSFAQEQHVPYSLFGSTLFIKGNEKYYERIEIKDILYIRSERNGVTIVALNSRHFSYNTLQSVLDVLKDWPFQRIHKQVVIHLYHVMAISDKEVVLRDGSIHPIGRVYQNRIEQHFRLLRPKKA